MTSSELWIINTDREELSIAITNLVNEFEGKNGIRVDEIIRNEEEVGFGQSLTQYKIKLTIPTI